MSKQDRQGVRTARDLEQKYKFGTIEKAERNVSQQRESLSRFEQSFSQSTANTNNKLNDLQQNMTNNENTIANTKTQVDGLEKNKLSNSGWSKNKFLGTDEEGNVVEKDVGLSVYPVGSIYTTIATVNPSALFGGTWELIAEGQLLVGLVSESEIPELFQANDKCFIWKRTA